MPFLRVSLRRAAALLTLFPAIAVAQAAGAPDPDSLARLVMRTFESGSAGEFAAIFPDSAGRSFMRNGAPKQSDLARVIRRDGDRAVLLLAGTTQSGNGAAQTNNARHFSGFYEAVRANGVWTVERKIPFDTANYIRGQRLTVDVEPGKGIAVIDTLTIDIGAPHGFAFRINNDVKFRSIHLNGARVEPVFGGGVVWIDAPPRGRSTLVLDYTLAESRPRSDSAGTPAFGAYHNTDIWHPAFDYISANHLGPITATVRIPAEYHLTTTVPQTVTVTGVSRTVRADSRHPAFLLALIWDKDWQPKTTDFGTFVFESFLTPGFRHSHDTLAARTKAVYDLLAPRFGEPQFPSRYLAVVEDRALGPSGNFNVRMNNAAISPGGGGSLGSITGQIFAHETGHAWTINSTGLGSNFLHEAWAKYVESLALRAEFGPEAEADYWDLQWSNYMVGNDRRGWQGGFEGRQSILEDFDNGRIHYMKGSWILRAAAWVMGDSVFNQGMRYYIEEMVRAPGSYETLITAWSRAAGRDVSGFVMPWLRSRWVPRVEAKVEGGRLIVTQVQPGETFELPKLEVELATTTDTVIRMLDLVGRADTIDVGNIGPVTRVRVDPNHRFLVHREFGEIARFELPASAAPGADSVQLASNFLRSGTSLPARREGDRWVVEVPLLEGNYAYVWLTPGDPRGQRASSDPVRSGTRQVRPIVKLENAYPGR